LSNLVSTLGCQLTCAHRHHFLKGSLSRSGNPFRGGDDHVWADENEVLAVFGPAQGFETPPLVLTRHVLEDGTRTAVSYLARKRVVTVDA